MKSGRDEPFPFFVYGTLLPGQPNYYLWQGLNMQETPATLDRGQLYDLGMYPMLVAGGFGRVRGLLMSVSAADYDVALTRLDYLEGYHPDRPDDGDFRRRKAIVRSTGGRECIAWVYLGRRRLITGCEYLNSDWPAYSSNRRQSMADWWQDIATVRDNG